jgi:pimeloyl-ACP methyl ester carboxylesterase
MKKISPLLGVILFVLLPVFGFITWNCHLDIPVEDLKEKYAGDASRFMEMDGMKVHYRDQGKGQTVVLLHGFAASLHTWDRWTEVISREARVVRLDLPGYGLTGPNGEGDYSMDWYTAFLARFLDRVDATKVTLVGNSLGGRISWEFALRYPERVSRLVLIDAAGYPMERSPSSLFKILRTPVLSSIARWVTPRFVIETAVEQVYGDPSRIKPGTVDRYHRFMLREGNRRVMTEHFEPPINRRPPDLDGITMPVLIMWGEKDAWIPVRHGHLFRRDLPRSILRIYDSAGHVPMEEIPEKTVKDFLEFFRAV